MTTPDGAAKKFLYTGPGSKSRDQDVNQDWNYTHNREKRESKGEAVDLEDVWSIKKNVGIANNTSAPNTDKFSLNADTKFYSRYNSLKEKDKPNQNKTPSSFTDELIINMMSRPYSR
ncbi:uncharacterized protein LOC126811566 isoform X2 [Patella vulgata]|uniref:uncharacterized protein LOC126811566 isoform X2 n=1 Tax=Patella vulgata TaxID=6465 RepID=UPI0021807E0E|nr:uncharacterized protein LOC126811566 isoform X2 [Patella vulgata]